MERKQTTWGLILTFREHGVEVEQAKKALKSMLNSLRYKANQCNWRYDTIAVVSQIDPRTKIPERTHIHMFLDANPGSTIVDWIEQYWHKRNGITKHQPANCDNQFISYLFNQASHIFQQNVLENVLNTDK